MTVVASIYLITGCTFNAVTPSQRGLSSDQNLLSEPQIIFFIGAVMFFAPLLPHLALVFPKRRPILARLPVFRWVYGPPFTIAAAAIWTFVTEVLHDRPKAYWPLIVFGWAIATWAAGRGLGLAWAAAT